jgi:hypothetical protein
VGKRSHEELTARGGRGGEEWVAVAPLSYRTRGSLLIGCSDHHRQIYNERTQDAKRYSFSRWLVVGCDSLEP